MKRRALSVHQEKWQCRLSQCWSHWWDYVCFVHLYLYTSNYYSMKIPPSLASFTPDISHYWILIDAVDPCVCVFMPWWINIVVMIFCSLCNALIPAYMEHRMEIILLIWIHLVLFIQEISCLSCSSCSASFLNSFSKYSVWYKSCQNTNLWLGIAPCLLD